MIVRSGGGEDPTHQECKKSWPKVTGDRRHGTTLTLSPNWLKMLPSSCRHVGGSSFCSVTWNFCHKNNLTPLLWTSFRKIQKYCAHWTSAVLVLKWCRILHGAAHSIFGEHACIGLIMVPVHTSFPLSRTWTVLRETDAVTLRPRKIVSCHAHSALELFFSLLCQQR